MATVQLQSRRPWRWLPFLVAVILFSLGSAARSEVTDEEVRQAIAQAVARLKEGQKVDGHWEPQTTQASTKGAGGVTALAVFTLLQAGEPVNDPVVALGLRALERVPDFETYVVSMKLMAFAKAEQVAGKAIYKAEIQKAVKFLQNTQSAIGTWGYEESDAAGGEASLAKSTDNSNTQMALLALYEAARAGYAVESRVWKKSEDYYVRTQEPDGSWRYRHGLAGLPKTGSMTAAGLASLLAASSQLQTTGDCGCGESKEPRYRTNQPIAQALAWLGKDFSVERNPGLPENAWHHYYLYAVERVGILGGLKTIGGHDWFREGAEYLVRHQKPDGRFVRSEDRGGGLCREYEACFAILFLAKGHVPALVSKLRWSDKAGQWNWNYYDAENLTRWIGEKLNGRALAWQAVGFEDSLEVWLKAPILYIAGREAPTLSAAQLKRLRDYVEQGGTILADANCGNQEFAEAMRKAARTLFPESPLEVLPEGHGVYTSYEKLPATWPIEGVTFGCRTSFLLSAKDLGCAWELSSRPESVAGLKMGLNLAAYATARQPLPERLAASGAGAAAVKMKMDRMALYVGKVRHHDRDWNSRPQAMDRLLEELRTKSGLKVANHAVPVGLTDAELGRFPVLYMAGHYDPALTAEEKARLKDYLERGGFLFAEACCGMEGFDKGFRALAAEMFPDAPLERIALDSPLLNGQVGYKIDKVRLSGDAPGAESPTVEPRLEGLKIGDRWAVIYSPLAIGPGLDGIATFHSRGYAADDARRLAMNIMLYALKF